VLNVRNLNIIFPGSSRPAVLDVSFSLQSAERVGIVGESGSGKSLTAMALCGILPPGARAGGEADIGLKPLRFNRARDWEGLRGRQVGVVFQEPGKGLNPLLPCGEQVAEVIRLLNGETAVQAVRKTERLFAAMGLQPVKLRMQQYPHQLSGGMKQRVMLAAAVCCNPRLLIADEPTTALDVSVQAQILCLLRDIAEERQAALLLISHDLGVIACMCRRVLVMCGGMVVEEGPVGQLFSRPLHPYTRLLTESALRLDRPLRQKTIRVAEAETGACPFRHRCPQQKEICVTHIPALRLVREGHSVRCHVGGRP
jgi:peptide/nickel transport system ATP-binding protein